MRQIARLFLVVVVLMAWVAPALAQTPTPNEINAVARDLWCPLCSGVRLDNCELQACVQMKEVIAEKLTAGESSESIRAYFVTQYGDVVLGQPSREGFNLIAWLFPILAAVVGLGWMAYLVATWRKKQARSTAPNAQPESIRQPDEESDDYMKRVERELNETE
jgi:cytochrome c-type biogenesis protein CcmH